MIEQVAKPSKEFVIDLFKGIINEKYSREEVADWANYYLTNDIFMDDDSVWKLIKIASGVDLQDAPGEYLHVEKDIQDWIGHYS